MNTQRRQLLRQYIGEFHRQRASLTSAQFYLESTPNAYLLSDFDPETLRLPIADDPTIAGNLVWTAEKAVMEVHRGRRRLQQLREIIGALSVLGVATVTYRNGTTDVLPISFVPVVGRAGPPSGERVMVHRWDFARRTRIVIKDPRGRIVHQKKWNDSGTGLYKEGWVAEVSLMVLEDQVC